MVLRGRHHVSFALMLVGIAALLVSGGAWALFSGYGFVLLDAATGATTEVRHLNDLFTLQTSTWSLATLVAVMLLIALVILVVEHHRRERAIREIVASIKALEAGASRELHAHEVVAEPEIAAAIEALAKAVRGRRGDGGSNGEVEDIKTRFLEIISHQLRSPLTAVRWNIESLLRGEAGALNRRQEEVLRITDKNYQNLLVMISDWVEALEIERGLLRLNPETVDVRGFLETLVDELKSQAKLKRLRFRLAVRGDLPLIYADKHKLQYVLSKLLHNAMSYTREGGHVALRASREAGFVRFEVQDDGVGIPPEEQSRIFKKFFRASNAALMQPNASGVGLFVAKRLIEAHGGAIGFSSVEGRGTVFHFTLPVSEAPKGAAAAPAKAVTARKRRPARDRRST